MCQSRAQCEGLSKGGGEKEMCFGKKTILEQSNRKEGETRRKETHVYRII